MTMSELATIVQEKINIKIAIINNGFLGMVRQWQEFFYDKRYVATPLVAPDFAALANAFGIRGERITKRAEVVPDDPFGARIAGTVLIDFRVEQEDSVYPMVPAGASLQRNDSPPQQSARRNRHRAVRSEDTMQTLVAYVENKPGVLNRVASLARRLAINIDSLTVGPTENEEIARMTIVAHTDEQGAHRLEASLEKLVDVLLAENISARCPAGTRSSLDQSLADQQNRPHLMELIKVFRARVVDVAPESLIIEVSGTVDKIDGLLEVCAPSAYLEMARSGRITMTRGGDLLRPPIAAPPKLPKESP